MKFKIKVMLLKIPIIGNRFVKNTIVKLEGGYQKSTTIREYTKLNNKVDVGMYSYGGCFESMFNYYKGGTISTGRYCSFASDIHYFGANHPMEYVSMSPYFYNKSFGYNVKDVPREHLNIGHGVWCGYGVIITARCHTIGNGSVIAAGSVVTKDVPAYAIAAGNPARIIGYRFDEKTILLIEESQWWEKNPDELIRFYGLIDNPYEFTKKTKEL